MNNKPFIIIVAIVILLGLGVSIYSLLFKNSSTSVQTNTGQNSQQQNQNSNATSTQASPGYYSMSVNYLNQTISGQVTINGTVLSLDQAGLNNYGLISLNNTNDIMWLKCAIGYDILSPFSGSGNKVTTVGDSVNIEILPSGQNNLAATCKKN